MAAVDLNADLGEGDELTQVERSLLGQLTSASISCGAHAGSPEAIAATVGAAAAAGVVIGAHPSYPDRAGAGRRAMALPPPLLIESLSAQIATVETLARSAGSALRFVKPHGALYNRMAVDGELARLVAEVVRAAGDGLVLLARAGSPALAVAGALGLPVAGEAFADRAYLPDGQLVPRSAPGAVLDDEEGVVGQALSIASQGRVLAVDGSWVPVSAASLCVHGDTPGAATLAAAVRRALVAAGVDVQPFAR